MPSKGHSEPKTIEGHKDEWKKAQKKPKNNITSEEINKKNLKLNLYEQLKYDDLQG